MFGYATKAIVRDGNWLQIQRDVPTVPSPGMNWLCHGGIPGRRYSIQFATNLVDSPWSMLETNVPIPMGRGTVIDQTPANDTRVYRLGALSP